MTYFAVEFTSSDAEQIEERMRSRSARTRIRGHFDYTASFRGDETFALGRSTASAGVQIESSPQGLTITHTSGSSPWDSGEGRGDLGATPVLFGRDRVYRAGCEAPIVATSVTFEHSRLTALARAYFGRGAKVRLQEAWPTRPATSTVWKQLTELIHAAPLEQPLVRANAYRALAFAVCDTFTVVDDRKRAFGQVSMRRRLHQRAADHLETHASSAIGVDDAAVAIGVSVQELRRLFLAYAPLGHSPEQHLRLCRLRGARQELLHAAPRSTTVRAVASKWGFAYPGTFVRLHLEHYGEPPHLLLE